MPTSKRPGKDTAGRPRKPGEQYTWEQLPRAAQNRLLDELSAKADLRNSEGAMAWDVGHSRALLREAQVLRLAVNALLVARNPRPPRKVRK